MEKHILYDGKDIQMVGYTVTAMKDFLFIPDTNKTQKTFTFDVKRDSTNWHSIEGGGFLFNASIENNILKGYCLLITQEGLKLDEIPGINLTQFRDGKYEYVENAGKKLATYNIGDVYANHSWKIVVDPESISLWDNGTLIIDNYKLPNKSYGSGFGPITSHAGHSCQQMSYFTFKNIKMTTIVGKSMTEALEEFSWRNGAERVLVNLSDESLFELSSDDKVAQIATKLVQKEVDFYGLGNEGNRAQYEAAIRGTAGAGAFALNDDLAAAMDNFEAYVLNKFNGQDYSVEKYIQKGEEVSYNKSYSDIENDPENAVQWKFIHNPDVYENSEGIADFNDKPLSEPVKQFDRAGDYTIYLKAQDNPVGTNDALSDFRKWSDEALSQKTVSVHRVPVVTLDVKTTLNDDKTACLTSVEESAVDLDHESEADGGIVKKEYKWKNVKDESWKYEVFPTTLPLNNDYIFVLTATDKEGVVSEPAVAFVSTKSLGDPIQPPSNDTTKPTVSLSLSKTTVVIGETIVITATMADNVGVAYTKATVDGKPVYLDTKGICTYVTDKVGTFVVRVEVYDAAGNTAAAEKTLTVKADMPPTVSISPSASPVAVNQKFTITINASDDVKVAKVEA
jgi:hypothetical protein